MQGKRESTDQPHLLICLLDTGRTGGGEMNSLLCKDFNYYLPPTETHNPCHLLIKYLTPPSGEGVTSELGNGPEICL